MENNSKRYTKELSFDQKEQPEFLSRDGALRDRALSITNSVKMAKSNEFFKTTRVDSCSYVVVKNGVAQAIPYRPKPKVLENIPFYNQSENQTAYKLSPTMHVGMKNKPLMPYNPIAYRNRLPVLDAKKPPKNTSAIELGERSNIYGNFGRNDPITNTGIIAERAKWHHYLQNK